MLDDQLTHQRAMFYKEMELAFVNLKIARAEAIASHHAFQRDLARDFPNYQPRPLPADLANPLPATLEAYLDQRRSQAVQLRLPAPDPTLEPQRGRLLEFEPPPPREGLPDFHPEPQPDPQPPQVQGGVDTPNTQDEPTPDPFPEAPITPEASLQPPVHPWGKSGFVTE